jgi:hypothetical protein
VIAARLLPCISLLAVAALAHDKQAATGILMLRLEISID